MRSTGPDSTRDRIGPRNGECLLFLISHECPPLSYLSFLRFLLYILTLVCEINRMGLKRDGAPIQKFLKEEAYKEQIPPFKERLAEIGKAQGWGLEELQKRFSNGLWDEIIYS